MSTNYRALCAVLTAALLDWQCETGDDRYAALINRARALLDQPVAPTDEELLRMAASAIEPFQHESSGIAIGEYEPETERAIEVYGSELIDFARAVLARWGTPAIQPVPVSERWPDPKECDAEGGCWWWHPGHKEDDFGDGWILLNPKWAVGRRDSDDSLIYTHWLPANALHHPRDTND